jgi:hypothetical protein
MAHYALLDESNIVVDVFVGKDETELVEGIESWEKHYEEFHPGLKCVRTSYNTFGNVHREGKDPFRKNYAIIGGTYSSELDAFIPVKPDNYTDENGVNYTFILNEETCLWEEVIND